MSDRINCPACEEGTCLEHGTPDAPAPASAPDAVTREELQVLRKKVAKSVKRLNRAIKEARRERAEPPVGITPSTEPEALPEPPQRRMSDAARLGLGVFRSCKRHRGDK